MSVTELFEYPLPVLKTDTARIDIETAGVYEGGIIIKNAGGGELKGKILSNSSLIIFTPNTFASKKTSVSYHADTSALFPGDIIHTSAVIMSNGGEVIIPVVIKALPYRIDTDEGVKITSLEDFAAYAKEYTEPACALFASNEFAGLLKSIEYPHIKAYESFLKDPVRARGLDNFLILSKLKSKAVITPKEKTVNITVNPYMPDTLTVSMIICRTCAGYVNERLTTVRGVKWLNLHKTELTSDDFNNKNEAAVDIFIEPEELTERIIDHEIISIGGGGEITVYAQKLPPLLASIPKESYTQNEKGYITVTNNTGKDVLMELTVTDTCLRFEGAKYFIAGEAMIPFEIKQTGFLSLRRNPSFETSIFLSVPEHNFEKKLNLWVGL